MIQRIQSIWLLLASIIFILMIFVPMATSNFNGVTYEVFARGLYQKTDIGLKEVETFLPLMISTIALALICLVNIFNFRHRGNQKRIILASVVLAIGLSFWCGQYVQNIPGGFESADYSIGTFLPIIAIICCGLAIRGINKDEKLIKSADRLR